MAVLDELARLLSNTPRPSAAGRDEIDFSDLIPGGMSASAPDIDFGAPAPGPTSTSTTSPPDIDFGAPAALRAKPASAMTALGRGVDQLQGEVGRTVQAIGEATGNETLTNWGREVGEHNEAEMQASGAPPSVYDIRSIGDAAQWLKEQGLQQIPVMAPSMAGGAAGALAGSALGPVGATIGGIAGAFVPSWFLGVGEVQSGIKEKDKDAVAPGWAFAGGTAIAALDSILPGHIGSSLIRQFGKEAAEEIAQRTLLKRAKEGVVKRIGKEGGKDALVEGTTEAVQEAIGEYAAAHGAEMPVNWAGLPARMGEAGAVGAVLGGITGGAQGAHGAHQDRTLRQAYRDAGGDDQAFLTAVQPPQPQQTPGEAPSTAAPPPAPTPSASEQAAQPQDAVTPTIPDFPSAEPIGDLIAQGGQEVIGGLMGRRARRAHAGQPTPPQNTPSVAPAQGDPPLGPPPLPPQGESQWPPKLIGALTGAGKGVPSPVLPAGSPKRAPDWYDQATEDWLNRRSQTVTYETTSAYQARIPEAVNAVESELRRMLPERTALSVTNYIRAPGVENVNVAATYETLNDLVRVSLSGGTRSAKIKGFHEVAAHALRGGTASAYRSVYEPEEWKLLVEQAKKVGAENALESPIPGVAPIEAYRRVYRRALGRSYSGAELAAKLEEMLDQERVGALAEQWAAGTDFGSKVNGLLARIIKLLAAIRNALRGMGFQTYEDVFQSVAAGEIAQRADQRARKADEEFEAEWTASNAPSRGTRRTEESRKGTEEIDTAGPSKVKAVPPVETRELRRRAGFHRLRPRRSELRAETWGETQHPQARDALDQMDTFELRHLAKDLGLAGDHWRGRSAAQIRKALKSRSGPESRDAIEELGFSLNTVSAPPPISPTSRPPQLPAAASQGPSAMPPPLPKQSGRTPPPIPPAAAGARAGAGPSGGAAGGAGGMPPSPPPPVGGGGMPPGGSRGTPPGGTPPSSGGFSLDRYYSDRIKSWATTLNNWWNPIERLPRVRDYRVGKYQALGRKASADELARDLYDRFAAASEADKRAAFAYLTDAAGDLKTIADPRIRALSRDVKRLFNAVGQQLVDRGMLSQEAVDRYKDQYLPRVYLKHLVGDKERLGGLVQGVNVARPSDQGYLKHRKDLDAETRALLGEVLDPGFLAARGMARTLRDLAIIDFLDAISAQDDWVFRDSLVKFDGRNASPYYLMTEAESLDLRAIFEPDPAIATMMRTRATAMRTAAQPAIRAGEQVPGGFSQIPNSARYGMLRGMYVRSEIVNDLLPSFTILPDDASSLEKLFGQSGIVTQATRVWKALKVPLNPATQVRNALSNAIMLNLSGMSPLAIVRYMRLAVRDIKANGPNYRFAQSMGLKASGFSETELTSITREFLDYERTTWSNRSFAPVTVPVIMLKHILQRGLAGAGNVYQFFESLMKIAKMMHGVEMQGLSQEDAYLEAQRWLFDYSEVPRTVRYLRNAPVGAPFITYQYKSLPLILEVAATKPWRLAPYVAVPFAMAAIFAALYGVDDDDVEKLKQALPESMRKKQNAAILPGKDEAGRWRFLDFGYLLPWSSWQNAAAELAGGKPMGALKEIGMLSGPVPDIFIALKTNVDSFTGRPIADPRDPPEVRATAVAAYAWRVVAPPWLTDQSFVRRMWESWQQTPSGYYGEPPLTMPQAALRGLGLNVYPVDPERTRETNIFFMRKEIQDARRRMRSRLKDQRLDDASRQRLRRSYEQDIMRRRQELERYMRESEVHPALGSSP